MLNRQARAVLGIVGGFVAMALATSAATGTAHADAISDILADLTTTEAAATTAFTASAADFASGHTADGFTQLFIGLDDDLLGIPNELQVGLIDALQGVPVIPASDFIFNFATPASFLASVTEANNFYLAGAALITTIMNLPATDFANTALDNALSTIDQYILPEQIELIAHLAYGF